MTLRDNQSSTKLLRPTIIAAIITTPRHRLAILIVARFPSRLSRYKPQPNPLFEPPDRLAERRLRDAELGRGPGEAHSCATARKVRISSMLWRAIDEYTS